MRRSRCDPRVLCAAALLGLLGLVGRVDAADAAAGMKVSARHCAKCHGDTGQGDGSGLQRLHVDVTPVPWTDKAAMAKWRDQDLVTIIRAGGRAVGKSKVMPSYRGKLTDAEIADLVAYIRSLAK